MSNTSEEDEGKIRLGEGDASARGGMVDGGRLRFLTGVIGAEGRLVERRAGFM